MDYPHILREIMRVGPFKQGELAKRLKVEQPTISRWLSGAKPKVAQHQRIIAEAERLGLLAPDVHMPEPPPDRLVRVVGYVGAGSRAHHYALSQGDLEEVPAPEDATELTVAVEVKGESLGPLFDRWLVFYDDVRRPVTADLIGRLCVVGLSDDRILIKKLRNGSRTGLYKLLSANEDSIDDVVIEWAARVKSMVPR